MTIWTGAHDRIPIPATCRPWLMVPVAVLFAATVVFAVLSGVGTGLPLAWQAAGYLLGMLALNLPHGGVEEWLLLRRHKVRTNNAYLAVYIVLLIGFVAFYLAAPVAGVFAAVLVACAKAGHGDLAAMSTFGRDRHLAGRGRRCLAAASRGGAIMVVPAAADPTLFESFAGMMVGLVDTAALPRLKVGFDWGGRLVLVGFLGALASHVTMLAGSIVRPGAHRSDALRDLSETGLLLAFFWTVPVLVAVGLYFPAWYSALQLARERALAPNDETTRVAARRAGHGVIALLMGTIAAGTLFIWVLPAPPVTAARLYDAVALWTMFIAAIALPHVVLGGWFLQGTGIWRTDAG